MKKETLKNIFDFIKKEDNKVLNHKDNFLFKLKYDIPMTKDELTFNSNLSLVFSQITSLPEGLHVKGDLDLASTQITSLPKEFYVEGDLWLSGSEIETLPEGLYVGGELFLDYCNKLKSLPKGLEVDGGVNITYNTQLTKYTKEELRKMIEPGYIKGDILNEDPEWVEFF
jgi:hypothetical protein